MKSSTATHTPGPWFVTIEPLDPINGEGGMFVHTKEATIAVCDASQRLSNEEMEANTYLIGAAPEMYELLRLAPDPAPPSTEWLPLAVADLVSAYERWFDRMVAVLQKAEGQS